MSRLENNFKSRNRELPNLADDEDSQQNVQDEKQSIHKADFNNSYEMGPVIASGGLKVVRKVRDRKTGRHVAMAQLRPDYSSNVNSERFLREARTLASLEHSNIVPIHEINYDEDDNLFFTMKLLSGETLSSIIKRVRGGDEKYVEKFNLSALIKIFIQVCDAIIFAHSKDICHLDLKPANIQISEFGEVSVIDWGMAKKTEEIDTLYENTDLPSFTPLSANVTKAGTVSGTPGYMSPEQASNNELAPGIPSDIYSLGATLYALLYLKHPYEGLSTDEVIRRTREGIRPEFPEESDSDVVPNALRAIAEKAMNPDIYERYENVSDLKNDIILYLNDFATVAEGVNFRTFSLLFLKRHYRAISVFMSVTAIILTTVFFAYEEIQKHREIIREQSMKVSATSDEIISGTLEKEKLLRSQRAYDEMQANYAKLKNLGYNYPEFWYNEARLYAGEMQFSKLYDSLKKIKELESSIKHNDMFKKMMLQTEWALSIQALRPLSHEEKIEFARNLDMEVQDHILWNMNQDPNKGLDQKLHTLFKNLCLYNPQILPKDLNFKQNVKDGYITIDISNNPTMIHCEPLLGMPMDELNLSNTNVNINSISSHIKENLSVLKISGNKVHFINHYIADCNYWKLIARNTFYSALDLKSAPYLKYLDIEGSHIGSDEMIPSDTLEYLNIAYSDFKHFNLLPKLTGLKTLVIDNSMNIPRDIQTALKELGVKLIKKNVIEEKSPNYSIVVETLKKEKVLRDKRSYLELLSNYEKLKDLGYSDPDLWYNKARLHAGELDFESTVYCLEKITGLSAYFDYTDEYEKMLHHSRIALDIYKSRNLTHLEIIDFALNMDVEIQDHILWNMNTAKNTSVEDKLQLARENIFLYNPGIPPEDIHFEYEIENDYIKLDLSNNPKLVHVAPLLGIPMDELDLSNTSLNITSISNHLKNRLKVLKISGSKFNFIDLFLRQANFEKLIVRNSVYGAMDLAEAPNLKHLDIQGCRLDVANISASPNLEYLNVAFSRFHHYDLLPKLSSLEALVVDQFMRIPQEIIDQLKERGVAIIVKTDRD